MSGRKDEGIGGKITDYLEPDQTLPKEDSGVLTRAAFRYQDLITILYALKMYNGDLKCEELYCEMHDDILIRREDGLFEAIQVKTRVRPEPFGLTDEPIIKSLQHFVELDKDFPSKFAVFWIVADGHYRSDGTQLDVGQFLEDMKTISHNGGKPKSRKGDAVLDLLVSNTGVDRDHVIRLLAKVIVVTEPPLDSLESLIVTKHLRKIPLCNGFSLSKLERIFKDIEREVSDASSGVLRDPSIKDYFAFMEDGKAKLNFERINSRRITRERVENTIKASSDVRFYLSTNAPVKLLEKSDLRTMQDKMTLGGIDNRNIANMLSCVSNAEEFIFSQYYKGEWAEDETILAKTKHIQHLILTRATDAESLAKSKTPRYGLEMLHLLEKKLENLTNKNYSDFLPISYDVLKGFMGILTGHCLIWFSEKGRVDGA